MALSRARRGGNHDLGTTAHWEDRPPAWLGSSIMGWPRSPRPVSDQVTMPDLVWLGDMNDLLMPRIFVQ